MAMSTRNQDELKRVHQVIARVVEHVREELGLDVLQATPDEMHARCCPCFEAVADIMNEEAMAVMAFCCGWVPRTYADEIRRRWDERDKPVSEAVNAT